VRSLILVARIGFGAWMLANGLNHFFLHLWPTPIGHEPLAAQLMAALAHSRLLDVAMAIELVTGALILCGVLVPLALCVVMPICTCALYWFVVLEHQPLGAALALGAFGLNGLLMLAYLEFYRGALQRSALAFAESSTPGAAYAPLFVNANGRTARGPFTGALITVLAVLAFYAFRVTGLTAHWCMLMLVVPGAILHARRLHDMGFSAWLLVVPVGLTVVAFAIWLHLLTLGARLDNAVPMAALAICAGFALWGCLAPGRSEANRFGGAVAA
jgi:uncharacterized membrane protein YhaH (DUF805 family)/uncharacterized membrane protein YphA (DoxX/SURF4 family)